ncbi:hypothetical protein RUND412_004345 [Rhizina undulata]
MNARGLKKHSACDECRFRKLRCSGNDTGCERCIRDAIPCVYSAQKPMGRPRKRRRSEHDDDADPVGFQEDLSTAVTTTSFESRSADLGAGMPFGTGCEITKSSGTGEDTQGGFEEMFSGGFSWMNSDFPASCDLALLPSLSPPLFPPPPSLDPLISLGSFFPPTDNPSIGQINFTSHSSPSLSSPPHSSSSQYSPTHSSPSQSSPSQSTSSDSSADVEARPIITQSHGRVTIPSTHTDSSTPTNQTSALAIFTTAGPPRAPAKPCDCTASIFSSICALRLPLTGAAPSLSFEYSLATTRQAIKIASASITCLNCLDNYQNAYILNMLLGILVPLLCHFYQCSLESIDATTTPQYVTVGENERVEMDVEQWKEMARGVMKNEMKVVVAVLERMESIWGYIHDDNCARNGKSMHGEGDPEPLCRVILRTVRQMALNVL